MSSEEGVENVTGFIERDSNGVTLEMDNIGCYSEVLAYENITGVLPFNKSINAIISVTCTSNGKQFIVPWPLAHILLT